MDNPPWVLVLLWDAWFIYWVVSASKVPKPPRRDRSLALWAYRGPMILAGILLLAPYLTLGLGQRYVFEPSFPLVIVGVALTAAGLSITVWARISLGSQWTGRVGVNDDHRLIITGPYRFVRHPIYTGILLAFVGSFVAMGTWGALGAMALAVPALWFKLRREERWLAESLPEYDAYRARVPALVPGLKFFSGARWAA